VSLIISSSSGVNAGSGTVMEVFETGMEAEEFLRAFLSLEPLLLSLLTPCGTVGLFNSVVAARRGNHLLVVDMRQSRDFPDRRPITPELIGTDDLWDGIFAQKLIQKTLPRFRISVPLEQDIQHEAVLVHRPPEPMSNAINGRTHFVQKPAGTPSGFPLTQTICQECAELDAPFAQGFVTHLDAALVQQFLNVAVA